MTFAETAKIQLGVHSAFMHVKLILAISAKVTLEWSNQAQLPPLVQSTLPCHKNGDHTILQQGANVYNYDIYRIFYINVTMHRNKFLFNNQPDESIIQICSVIKLYMFRASSLSSIRSFLLYIQHW